MSDSADELPHDLSEDAIVLAHRNSIRHRGELEQSELCGCFYCGAVFPPTEITNWVKDGPTPVQQTALCPRCGIDSVIGSASGFPVTADFLDRMRRHWF